ncbi:MAG: hypothetical protein IJ153_03330 [Clostridia bacterium]|nr:hypothetical protein [Clostridia bacterium]
MMPKKLISLLTLIIMLVVMGTSTAFAVQDSSPVSPVIYLPNLGSGEWITKDENLPVRIETKDFTINESNPSEKVYVFQLYGESPGKCFIHADLIRHEEAVFYIDAEILVDENLNVLIVHVEAVPVNSMNKEDEE